MDDNCDQTAMYYRLCMAMQNFGIVDEVSCCL